MVEAVDREKMAAATGVADADHLFKLWPPSDSTRATLVQRMSSNLCGVSFASHRYAPLSTEEADEHAARIENEAFVFAEQEAAVGSGKSDSAIVQLYAKRASLLMLEAVKSKSREGCNGAQPSELDRVEESSSTLPAKHHPNGVSTREILRSDKATETEEVPAAPGDIADELVLFNAAGTTRSFLDGNQAAEVLKPLLEPGNKFTSICFSNLSFDKSAAEVAAKALAVVKHKLVDVNLADIVAGRAEADALAVMAILSDALEGSNLRSLNVSDNALGEKGVRAFSSLLKSQKSLEKIYFMNNGISEDAAKAICELLPAFDKLKTVHFHNNMTGDVGARYLSQVIKGAPLLEDFKFSSTRVNVDGAIALVEALRAGKSLIKLDLRDNMFGPEGGLALSHTLRSHAQLKEVYLNDLGLEAQGVIAISDALASTAPSVEVLELGGNEITETSAKSLASLIFTKKYLVRLNLAENELKDKGAVIVSEALLKGGDSLRELDLSGNYLKRVGAVAAARAVANKPHFKWLNLDNNLISESGIEAMREVLSKGLTGVSVLASLDDNDEDKAEGSEGEDEEASEDTALEGSMKGLGMGRPVSE